MAPSAKAAHTQAGKGDGVIGWKLDRDQRTELLQQFPPRYRNVDADHVTLTIDASPDAGLPEETQGEIVGRVDDGRGVEAMVVRIDGTTDRPDGSTYHITWSLDGRQAHESNDVLREREWVAFDLPMPVQLRPERWPRGG
ncbi:MAG: hypothetical protein QOI38_1749 [Sphingomonadales bacterium]|jgi:hypothetical protein|nr:hypothetical protein [Sphingomonadales bacterium]